MNLTLQNTRLTALFKTKGAELCSLTDENDTEYIWNANPEYWARHTPILFPLVGKVLNNEYCHENTTYKLGQHGFARDREFEVVEHTDSILSFKLSSDEESLKLYPFKFNLYVIYSLSETTLSITYKVENQDNTTIGFKIGAHPGFSCPLSTEETFEDYIFRFEKPENAKLMPLTADGYFTGENTPFTGQDIQISNALFANDALVLTELESKWVELRSKNTGKGIRLSFEGFPFLGLWSPSTPSPFVCIEPWFGHADCLSETEDFMSKQAIVTLPIHQTFECTHAMTIL